MSEQADIPEELLATARAVVDATYTHADLVRNIARAIMADRALRINVTGLTSQQAACLKAIAEHQARTGLSPTHDELRIALGLASKSGVSRLLHWLERRGRILRPANRSRAITIIPNPAN
jgi:hypothetical protein